MEVVCVVIYVYNYLYLLIVICGGFYNCWYDFINVLKIVLFVVSFEDGYWIIIKLVMKNRKVKNKKWNWRLL